jgi:surface antigen
MIRTVVVGAFAAGLIAGVAPSAQAQGLGSLGNIFNCNRTGSNQTAGALIGGALGGLAGASVARNDALGGIVGAVVGAAAGSYIGCRMGSNDQASLESATLRALNEGRPTTWTNPQTGASAQINVYPDASPQYGSGYGNSGYNTGYAQPISAGSLRLGQGVSWASAYETAPGLYTVRSTGNLRAAPSTQARVLGQVYRGSQVEALARVQGTPWILVGRNGQGIGYVSDTLLEAQAGYQQPGYGQPGYTQASTDCRIVEQVVTTRDQGAQTARLRACRAPNGGWSFAQA